MVCEDGDTGLEDVVRVAGARRTWLAMLCAGLPAAEVLVLITVGLRGSAALAPGLTAATPYGVYHDLRFLLTYHPSWPAFVLETAAMIVWRAAVDGCLVALAWPADVPRPAAAAIMRRTLALTAATAALLTPSAAAASAMDVLPVSYLFLGSMPVAVIVAALTCHGTVTSCWQRLPPPRAAAWSAGTFLIITAGGAAVAVVPAWAAPAAAAGAGLANAAAWLGIVRAAARRPRVRTVPLVPLSMAATAAVVIAAITLAVRVGAEGRPATYRVAMADTQQEPHVLLVSGFHSAWDGQDPPPLAADLPVERFSYQGLDGAERPLPYSPQATQQPLSTTVRLLSQQVEAVHRRSGRQVAIVADSEGSLAAETYLQAVPGAPVGKIVLLDPLMDPGRAYFPPANAEGWGVATGAILRGLGAAIGATTPLHIYADEPFIRSVDDHGPVLQDLLACPPGHVKELMLFSLADSVASPLSARVAAPSGVLPELHGYLLTDGTAARDVAAFLRSGQLPPNQRGAADRLVRAAAAAWQAPPLVPSLVPQWQGEPVSGCDAKQRAIMAWLG